MPKCHDNCKTQHMPSFGTAMRYEKIQQKQLVDCGLNVNENCSFKRF